MEMAPVSFLLLMFLISLFYTFSKIQETIWKSGKLEWRGQYPLSFPDVPDFLIHFSSLKLEPIRKRLGWGEPTMRRFRLAGAAGAGA